MSPTPYMQMISPCGIHLNTPHLPLTESRKLWTRYSSGQTTGVFRSLKWRHRPVFFLSTSEVFFKVTVKLGDKTLPSVETPTFIGVELTTRILWKPHIEDMETKGIKKFAVQKKLRGTHWGANSQDSENCLLGGSSIISGIWGQCLCDSSQVRHQ